MIQVNDKAVLDRVLSEVKDNHTQNPLFIKVALNSLHVGDSMDTELQAGLGKDFQFDKVCDLSPDATYSMTLQKSLCYLNTVVEDFITQLSSLIDDQNFIVVLTGEHRPWSTDVRYIASSLQSNRVPLIIFRSKRLNNKRRSAVRWDHIRTFQALYFIWWVMKITIPF